MRSVLAAMMISFMLLGAGCAMMVHRAFAQEDTLHDHDHGHGEYHDVYKGWAQPGLYPGSCCSARITDEAGNTTGDCDWTEARVVDGHWVARRPDGVWIDIPDERIIKEKNPDPTGSRAHLCYYYGQVLCFVPPTGGT